MTASVAAGPFVISPAVTVDVTIGDDVPSMTGYLLEVSYDAGGTWFTVGASQPLGVTSINPATALPSVVASNAVIFRATNNDTSVSGTSTACTLAADQIIAVQTGIGSGNLDGFDFRYQSDNAAASNSGGDPFAFDVTADTTDSNEAASTANWDSPDHVTFGFPHDLVNGGALAMAAATDGTWDRPAAVFTPPQNFVMF